MIRKLLRRDAASPKLLVIGLDCAPPELLFDAWRHELPHLGRLLDGGVHAELSSTIPAITVPAWSTMTSSRDPGALGFYGFRNRSDYTYDNRFIASGLNVNVDRVWDVLGAAGKQCIVVGVPQTYPVRPINGHLISSFLTPSTTVDRIQWTHPPELREEIQALLAPEIYDVDVPEFRTDNKAHLLEQIRAMTRKRFKVMRYLMAEKPWDFFMFVEMGVDRIHHGLWSHHDPGHRNHDPQSPFRHAIRDYYRELDAELGRLLAQVPPETHVVVVSDHGVKSMAGGICVNEWLRQAGYLTLWDEPPTNRLVGMEKVEVDWSRTQAWADGGYVARIFLNIAGREPNGIIPAADADAFRERLAAELRAIPGPDGQPLDTRVYKPEEIYATIRNVPPDLIVYFDNLAWRAVGSFGHPGVYTFENDTGPDDANHAQNGVFIYTPPGANLGGRRLAEQSILDIAPTLLKLMHVDIPEKMQGSPIALPTQRR